MKTHNRLTKLLAIVGTLLVWFPILAPIVVTLAYFFISGLFRFDYLMPAELFLAVIIGGGLLIWAAFRARTPGLNGSPGAWEWQPVYWWRVRPSQP